MGYSTYSSTSRTDRILTSEGISVDGMSDSVKKSTYDTVMRSKLRSEIFQQRQINNAMSPFNVGIRESRDSKEHPNSVAIIIALDVTGSMGSVPHYLVKNGLPNIMDSIINKGVADPQILFLGIGDHECDQAPLQVGQFESGDELLDKWLTTVYLEGGGGGNDGESYMLAWHFAAFYTAIDCLDKRGQKGFLFTIGDEPVLDKIPSRALKSIMGDGQHEDYPSSVLYDKARQLYNVYHIHIKETSSGSRRSVMDGWQQLLSDNLKVADRHEDVSDIISDTITNIHTSQETPTVPNTIDEPSKTEEMML